MKLFGTVTFTEGGRTYQWSSRESPPSTLEHPFDLVDDGIVIPTAVGPQLVDWDAIDVAELRGWSPVPEEDQ